MTPTLYGADDKPIEDRPSNDLAAEIVEQRSRSYEWLRQNYWDEWIRAFKNYKCNRDPKKDDNDPTRIDPSQSSVGMPDTWSMVRRQVARNTAQIPNLKFRADDPEIGDLISRTLMYQWDKGGVQRLQKKHCTQASIFGWSVRAWYWDYDERMRKRRVDPLDSTLNPEYQKAIQEQYGEKLQQYAAEGMEDPAQILARLIAEVGRGNLVPIEYLYKCYEGPRADFLFIGDCYPEPNFSTIQTSNWFIVARRRRKDWLLKLGKAYPELQAGIFDLIQRFPNGSPRSQGRIPMDFRLELLAVADRADEMPVPDSGKQAQEWTITERHIPGADAKLAYVGEDGVWIGEIPYPYDLEGKIAFTELIFVDDMLAGIGDSNPRIVRGLQELHSRTVEQRTDLRYNLLRPLIWTSDRTLADNPELLERGKGMRLVFTKAGQIGVLGEQGALAAASMGDAEEAGLMRMIQQATGESNMSMGANVDPQQARTATGARIMAYTGDVLTKDQVDMFTLALRDDLDMMYQLNRSELTGPVSFDGSQYTRHSIGASPGDQQQQNPQPMTAKPEHFQYDGEVEVEVGSTLADDDDAVLSKAQTIFQAATTHPELINQQKATVDLLIAMGKGKDLASYLPPPPPPPPPPEPKSNAAISIRFEMLSPVVQAKILAEALPQAGISVEDLTGQLAIQGAPPQPGAPPPPGLLPPGPPGPPGPPPGGAPQMAPANSADQPIGASAMLAAVGKSPLRPNA